VNDIVAGTSAPGTTAVAPEPAAAAAELVRAVSTVRRALRRAARQASPAEPLAPAQSELLRLAAARPTLTVAEAAAELRLAPNTVSTLVSKLTARGLLERGRSDSDGRTVRLAATAAARRRIAEFRDLRAELAGQALAGLSRDDQQALAGAVPPLLRLAERLEEETK
jgi:DNA-binding MarR family transcriptional regulator